MKKPLRVLLVNPYIYDVSAYGFWAAPLGLLQIGAILRQNGMEVSLLDCLTEEEGRRKQDGRAPFLKERVETPLPVRAVAKRFKRYGLSPEDVCSRLSVMSEPDLVLVTCIMTYWYQSAEEIVHLVRLSWPRARIVVGGLYVSLCEEHARARLREADLVVRNSDIGRFYAFLEETFSCRVAFKPLQTELDAFPFPAFDLYEHRHFVPLLTSFGCVYRCAYCASHYLYPHHVRIRPEAVLREISAWTGRGVSRFVLYDDNFLFRAEEYAKPLLASIGRLPFDVSFYNPNALNASLIDEETAGLLALAHFREVRLGLETIDPSLQHVTGRKITRRTFETAVRHLLRAGFPGRSIRTYVLAGLPFQRHEDVRKTVDYASDLGVGVSLAAYTPIPHTTIFERFHGFARYPIADEPLFQNNALFPFAWDGFAEDHLKELKLYVRQRNAGAGHGAADEKVKGDAGLGTAD